MLYTKKIWTDRANQDQRRLFRSTNHRAQDGVIHNHLARVHGKPIELVRRFLDKKPDLGSIQRGSERDITIIFFPRSGPSITDVQHLEIGAFVRKLQNDLTPYDIVNTFADEKEYSIFLTKK